MGKPNGYAGTPGDTSQIDPRKPIDSVVRDLIQNLHDEGKGFVLSLERLAAAPGAPGKGTGGNDVGDGTAEPRPPGVMVGVQALPPVPDEWEPLADFRKHTVEDVSSFAAYARKYGTPERSIVFFNDTGAALVIDDAVPRGKREIVSLGWVYDPTFARWEALLNRGGEIVHKDLLRFLLQNADSVADIGAIDAMRSCRITATVKMDSELKTEGNNFLVAVNVGAGEELKKFPKTIMVSTRILRDSPQTYTFPVALEVLMPDQPNLPVKFLLTSPAAALAKREAINMEFNGVRTALENWVVVRGSPNYATREVGRE